MLNTFVGWEMNRRRYYKMTTQRYSYFFKYKARVCYMEDVPWISSAHFVANALKNVAFTALIIRHIALSLPP
jgi:hypothetical protein